MKKIIMIAIVSMITSAAHAEHAIAYIRGTHPHIKTVILTDTGLLKVVRNDGSRAEMKLSRINAEDMKSQVQLLGQAEIKTEHHEIICMMFVAEFQVQNLFVVDPNTGNLKQVLSHRSCAMRTTVVPVHEYALRTAEELKASMLVLSNQLIIE